MYDITIALTAQLHHDLSVVASVADEALDGEARNCPAGKSLERVQNLLDLYELDITKQLLATAQRILAEQKDKIAEMAAAKTRLQLELASGNGILNDLEVFANNVWPQFIETVDAVIDS